MDNTALSAAHRVEEKGLAALFHLGCRSLRCQPQFFDALQAEVLGIKHDQRMVFVRQTQHFHRQVFKRKQQLRLVLQQQIRFGAAEFHNDVGIFNLGVGRSTFHKFVIDIDIDSVQQDVQKIADFVFVLFYWVFTSHVFRTNRIQTSLFLLLHIDDHL